MHGRTVSPARITFFEGTEQRAQGLGLAHRTRVGAQCFAIVSVFAVLYWGASPLMPCPKMSHSVVVIWCFEGIFGLLIGLGFVRFFGPRLVGGE